jgi:class 3 adenylate cyclase
MNALSAFIPSDRRRALFAGVALPAVIGGAALFADISGFTPLTAALALELGPQRGAELLTHELNRVFGAVIAEVQRYGGSVIGFSGDAITCWFDDRSFEFSVVSSELNRGDIQASNLTSQNSAALRAVACALDMQRVMGDLAAIVTPGGTTIPLGIKVAIAAGPCQRFLVGEPRIQSIEILAGSIMDRVAAAEHQAQRGEIVVAAEVSELLAPRLRVRAWRAEGGQRFAVIGGLDQPVSAPEWADDPEIVPEIARDWLLPPIYQRLARGESDFLGELRSAVPLFLKFNGLDWDHDDSSVRLDAYIRWAQHLLARYEGTLLQVTIGDKGSYCYAIFGAPVAHEDDAARAIAAALEFTNLPSELSFIRSTQIGISQGQMYAGAYGGPTRRTYGVLGNEVNVAARLMNLAQPGQILVSARVAESARQSYVLRPLGPLALKGQPEPVIVLAVESRKRGQASAAPRGQPAQLVGRAAERALIAESVRALRAGQHVNLLIEGEAGIGKSRLLGDLLAQAEDARVDYLLGAGDAIDRSTAYHAWRPIFNRLFDVSALADDPALESRQVLRERVLAHLEAAIPELIDLAPLLNAVLPLDLPDNGLTVPMSGDVRADNTADLLVGLLIEQAREQPLLIALEDAHWFDSASWTLARQLAASGGPLLLAISTRPLPEPSPSAYTQIRQLADTRHLPLETLPAFEVNALVCQRLGVRALPRPVENLIQTKAEGHPFFSEELAYALRDAGLIQIADGVCQLAPGVRELNAFDFPDTIQGVITSRVDRLPPAQQLTLKVASVIGRIFAYSTLADIYPVAADKPTLAEQLERLSRLDITRMEMLEPELTYIFKHILAQEAVYGLLLYAQRQQLHRAVASWYEHTHASDLSPFYPLLAYHWRQAGVTDKAIEYLEKAGEQALRGGAWVEAARFFEDALAIAESSAASGAASLEQRAVWQSKLGEASFRLGDHARGRVQSERAMAVFDLPVPTTTGRQVAGILRQLAGQIAHRVRPGHFLATAPAERRERMLGAVAIYQTLSQIYYFSREQGLSLYSALRQVNVAERAGPSLELAQAYGVMCIITGIFGLHGLAEAYFRRGLAVAKQLEAQPYVLANVLHRAGLYHAGLGAFQQARDGLGSAMEIYQHFGDRAALQDARGILASTEYFAGNTERVLELIAQFPSALSDDDRAAHLFWGYQWRSNLALRADRLDEVLELQRKMGRMLGQTMAGLAEINYYGMIGLVHWRQGDAQAAMQAAAKASEYIDQSKGVPISFFSLDGYAALAEIYMERWEALARAGVPTRQQQALALRACKNLHLFRRFFSVAEPAAWLYQGCYEWLAGHPARARAAWRKSLAAAARIGMQYEQARAHFEIGRRLDFASRERWEHLREARAIFARLGADYDARRAQEVLGEASQ